MKRIIVHTSILLGLGTFFFLTGWDNADPDYIRLEIAARVFATLAIGGIFIGCIEFGKLIK